MYVQGVDGIWRFVPTTGPVIGLCAWCGSPINQSGPLTVSYDPVNGIYYHAVCGAATPVTSILVTQ